jgi:hypothetical protein
VFAGGDFGGKLEGGGAIGGDDRCEFDGLDLDLAIVAISGFDFDLRICNHYFESLMFFGGDASGPIEGKFCILSHGNKKGRSGSGEPVCSIAKERPLR